MVYDINKFFRLSLDLLCIADTDGYFKLINPSFERVLGWPAEELLSRPFVDFIHPEDLNATLKEVEKLTSGIPTVSFENRYRCADGSYRNLLWTSYPEKGSGLLYAIAMDITERKEAEEKLSALATELKTANERLTHIALTDALTGIKNRRAFDEQLNYQMAVTHRAGGQISLLMIDVDHFKQYNDQHGHQMGGNALVLIASLLMQTVRASDMVARYGGEEFAVILPNTSQKAAVEVGEKLRTAVQNHPWKTKPLTISVGVATASFERGEEAEGQVLQSYIGTGQSQTGNRWPEESYLRCFRLGGLMRIRYKSFTLVPVEPVRMCPAILLKKW